MNEDIVPRELLELELSKNLRHAKKIIHDAGLALEKIGIKNYILLAGEFEGEQPYRHLNVCSVVLKESELGLALMAEAIINKVEENLLEDV